jgi:hypothetical protein
MLEERLRSIRGLIEIIHPIGFGDIIPISAGGSGRDKHYIPRLVFDACSAGVKGPRNHGREESNRNPEEHPLV